MKVYCVMRVVTFLDPGTKEATEVDVLQAIFHEDSDAMKYIKTHAKQIKDLLHVQTWEVQ